MNIKYCGTFPDSSGYGMANRNYITALYINGINLTTEHISQMADKADYGWIGNLCFSLQDKKIDYRIKFLHITPDMYPRYMENGKYHIGHLFWETDKLPKEWINPCNRVQEIWTLSEQQAEMIRNSGVTTPIKCFPQPINTDWADTAAPAYKVPNFDGFIFYSVFQWIERKNPEALLKNYWKTFEGKQDVCLVLKTYRVNYSAKEFEVIKNDIRKWKQDLRLKTYPKVWLVNTLFNTQQQYRLHKSGDVLISTSRGEGNGIPMVEASLMGKPVIYINKTGIADLFPKDIYYPIDCTQTQATQVHWIPWYTPDQQWYNIDEKALANQMMECYINRKEVKERGSKASEWVKNNLNYWKVGQQMKQRLEEISRFL